MIIYSIYTLVITLIKKCSIKWEHIQSNLNGNDLNVEGWLANDHASVCNHSKVFLGFILSDP